MKARRPPPLLAILAASLNCGLGLALFWAAGLRETPPFWHNAGGFPVSLREWVLIAFYPLTFLCLLLAAATSWLALNTAVTGRGLRAVLLGITLAQWILITAVVTVAVWNNLDNLINGRPLHWHPE